MNREQWKMKLRDALRSQSGKSSAPETAVPPGVPELPAAAIMVTPKANAPSPCQATVLKKHKSAPRSHD